MKSNKKNWIRSSVLAGAMSAATMSAPMLAYADIAEARRAADPSPGAVADAIELEELGQRQAKSAPLGEFTGGDPVIIVGASTLLFVLVIVLIVLLLT